MKKYNIKELKEKLERCKNIPLSEINLEDVDEISDIKIDKRKPSNERILDFLTMVKNPYVFKVKGKLVKMRFSDTDLTVEDCLTNVLNEGIPLFKGNSFHNKLKLNKVVNELNDIVQIHYDVIN